MKKLKQTFVNAPIRKRDAEALLTGKPVYTADLAPADCLIVKLLRCPHAFAEILEIDTSKAKAVPGIECVLTHENVPHHRFTNAGQSFPEPSPHDRVILDRLARYSGDPVAIVAGETAEAVDRALKLIKVKYKILEPVLDAREAKDNPILVHPEDDWKQLVTFFAGDAKRNLCSSITTGDGDVEKALADCDEVVEAVYQTQAAQQSMMEMFCAYSYMDTFDRLTIVASTQIPFHVRRIVATALGWPASRVRIIKPRIGGGFGAKQTSVCEIYPAVVTALTGKKAFIQFTREESMTASTPRHPMRLTVRLGATKDGIIRAIDLHTLSDTGAYGEHGPTTVGLSGHKSISMYRELAAWRFGFDVVYTNKMASGAYRGYGATQGFFAIESAVDEMAHRLGMDPTELRAKNLVRAGDRPSSYDGGPIESCNIDECLKNVKRMIGWDEKYPRRVMPDGKIRAVGMALALQGSGIASLDTASTRITLNEDGTYTLMIGATDMGTGCDTILAQMAADVMNASPDQFVVHGVDTDVSPYDKGSYASSTTYVTGNATIRTAHLLKLEVYRQVARMAGLVLPRHILQAERDWLLAANGLMDPREGAATEGARPEGEAAEAAPPADEATVKDALVAGLLSGYEELMQLKGDRVLILPGDHRGPSCPDELTLADIGNAAVVASNNLLSAHASFCSPYSPPPFMAGAAEIELDPETGQVRVLDYAAAVDCGTVINPSLARVQTEGGLVQAIGMALYEQVVYDGRGRPQTDSFFQYKIPNREEIPRIDVEFFSTYEETGPFGAKSIGELVIDTPAPAIANAIQNACGARLRELPILPEHILRETGVL